ncbi:hypothetical protein [Desulfovibrio sp.]
MSDAAVVNPVAEPVISQRKFSEVSLDDPFFDSLKEGYAEFADWFARKQDETAYVSYDEKGWLQGFLYLKKEAGPITDVNPPLNVTECLKVGTFKVIAHGTKLGERFVKIITDTVLNNGLRLAYLTIFPQHEPLIRILERFGFIKKGTKDTKNGIEDVYVKDLQYITGDPQKDYPVVDCRNNKKWLMAIKPDYHTNLFPDSILRNESPLMLDDIPPTNSIYKVYVGGYLNFHELSEGDSIIIYRTKDNLGPARYRAVITSLCSVVEVRPAASFGSEKEFIDFCQNHSVFNVEELKEYFKKNHYAVKISYNIAFPKRPTRGDLIDNGIIVDGSYTGLCYLSDDAFKKALELGEVREGFVIY